MTNATVDQNKPVNGRSQNRVRIKGGVRSPGCWEFHRHAENEAFFKQLGAEAQQVCLEGYCGASLWPSTPRLPPSPAVGKIVERPLPNYFADAILQEAFDERAGILEFEAGFDRATAEKLALTEISALFPASVE